MKVVTSRVLPTVPREGVIGEAMSTRTATWLAWSIWALALALSPITLLLQSLNDPAAFGGNVFNQLVLLVFATVGALVSARRPANPIGWLFCAAALLWATGGLALDYAVYTLVTRPGSLPGGAGLAWFGAWAENFGWFLMLTFLLLLFPTGRLPAPRWRPVAWLAAAGLALFTAVALLSPDSLDLRLPFLRNPLGIALPVGIFQFLMVLMFLVEGTAVVACVAVVIVRFRRATGVERQQLKWFAYATSAGLLGFGAFV